MGTVKMCDIFATAREIMYIHGDDLDAGVEYLITSYQSKDISADQLSFLIDKLVDTYLYN